MKSFIFLLCMMIISSCANSISSEKITRTPLKGSYSDDAVIEQKIYGINGMLHDTKIEGTKNGYKYSFSNNDELDNSKISGYIGGWGVKCEKDKIDDKIKCHIRKSDNKDNDIVMALFYNLDNKNLCVGYHDFPYKTASFRIDKNKPFKTLPKNDGCLKASTSLINKLKNGKNLVTRGMRFPYEYYEDREITLKGFSQALDFTNWIKARMNKVGKS